MLLMITVIGITSLLTRNFLILKSKLLAWKLKILLSLPVEQNHSLIPFESIIVAIKILKVGLKEKYSPYKKPRQRIFTRNTFNQAFAHRDFLFNLTGSNKPSTFKTCQVVVLFLILFDKGFNPGDAAVVTKKFKQHI